MGGTPPDPTDKVPYEHPTPKVRSSGPDLKNVRTNDSHTETRPTVVETWSQKNRRTTPINIER